MLNYLSIFMYLSLPKKKKVQKMEYTCNPSR